MNSIMMKMKIYFGNHFKIMMIGVVCNEGAKFGNGNDG